MTDDRGYDRDNRWGVGIEVIQKEHYYNYYRQIDQESILRQHVYRKLIE